jgi:hypothetical protein
MFDKQIEQRVYIKFLVKLEKTATETFDLLRQAHVWGFQKEEMLWKMTNDLAIR